MLQRFVALVMVVTLGLPPASAAADQDPEVLKGIGLLESGEYDQAIFVLDGAVRRLAEAKADPSILADAYLQLGIAYLGKGHEAAARARFREAVNQIRTMTLSPDKFPPKVIDLFESAREEALKTAPAAPVAASTVAPAPEKKGGKSKGLLIGLGVVAVGGGVAAAAGGGSSAPTTPADTRRTQTFTGIVNDGANYFQIVATQSGTMEATVTWEDGQRAVFIGCQWNDPPYTECGGTNNRTNNTTSVLTVPVEQRTYLLSAYNYDGRGAISYTLRVLHP
jgi:hypothetical protein